MVNSKWCLTGVIQLDGGGDFGDGNVVCFHDGDNVVKDDSLKRYVMSLWSVSIVRYCLRF